MPAPRATSPRASAEPISYAVRKSMPSSRTRPSESSVIVAHDASMLRETRAPSIRNRRGTHPARAGRNRLCRTQRAPPPGWGLRRHPCRRRAYCAAAPGEAFFRGILCNVLVCLAVWLSFATTDVAGRILAIVFPVAAFVALGFEHSVANMYILPAGDLAAGRPIDLAALTTNLLPVTLGNIVGGGMLVALVYRLAYPPEA
ncbi:MAG: formate/nitrite transporter family protein [Alphaproteobacteria bacterium]|nr:formate/nitrite transporter family protein [Alphaproteobacteria bacterium]